MHGEITEQVNLAHPIPVLIVYGTVVVPEDGIVHFYDDIYGHDAASFKDAVRSSSKSNKRGSKWRMSPVRWSRR